MKNVYAIIVREISEKTVCVKAEDLDEAIDKVESAYRNVEIILDAEDFCYKDVIPSPYAGLNGIVNNDELEEYRKDYQWIGED